MDKVDSMTSKEIVDACESLSLEDMEAPLKWNLLAVDPPEKLVTRQLILEVIRVRDNYETGNFEGEDRATPSKKTRVSWMASNPIPSSN